MKSSDIGIYDFNNKIPSNYNNIWDKIYKLSLLIDNQIRFINSHSAEYYFNLLAFSFSKDLLCLDLYGIMHNYNVRTAKFYDNLIEESRVFQRILSGNKSIPRKIIEDMNRIDYVFPYVSYNDSYWQHLFNLSLSGKEKDWEVGISRYRDNGLLKYLFRSLEKYLPWINQIHMIVMSDSQVPSWLNREKVHIIYHSDFIPKKYLPTFSSSLIEMFLPFLPLNTEKFIYSNDDLITFRNLSRNLFFKGNIPRYSINIRDYSEIAAADKLRRNAYNLLMGKKQDRRVIYTQHTTVSYKISLLKKCFKKYEKDILNSLSKFRKDKNLNQYTFAFCQMLEGTIINEGIKVNTYFVKPFKVNKIMNDDFKKYDFICFNDEEESTKEDWEKIVSKVEKLLPKKSKYEK